MMDVIIEKIKCILPPNIQIGKFIYNLVCLKSFNVDEYIVIYISSSSGYIKIRDTINTKSFNEDLTSILLKLKLSKNFIVEWGKT